MAKFCIECGTELIMKEDGKEGMIPFCPSCNAFRYPQYNVAVSMITRDKKTGKILLIKQYGRDSYILVAGYVNRGEAAEQAVVREVKEETGLTVSEICFNRTSFFERSNTLMCNFTAWVEDAAELNTNEEIDSCNWFTPEEARENIRPNSLAEEFLLAYLNGAEHE
ncbi:MAG: NUDIX domain-containing protein [Lachnospiraceae bacterium]|nr:NUDIX domain-containing protein [Lachnospiraceae bacterium]